MRSLGPALAILAVLRFPACGGKDEPETPATASVTPLPIDLADLTARSRRSA